MLLDHKLMGVKVVITTFYFAVLFKVYFRDKYFSVY